MTTPRYARLAGKALAETDSTPPPPDAEARAQAIAAVAKALRARRRKLQGRRIFVAAAAIAAVALAAFTGARIARSWIAPEPAVASAPAPGTSSIVARGVGSGSSVVVQGAEVPLDQGRSLVPGNRVVTPPSGRATLSFATGTTATLHEDTDLTVASDGDAQRLRLDKGASDFHVAKLGPGQRFIVDTSDTEVEVRGTRFRVSVLANDEGCGALTRVAVTEGVVVVRHAGTEDRIEAGKQWPSSCPSAAASAAVPSARGAGAPAFPPGWNGASASNGAGASSLAEQNDLFSRALAAQRRGDPRGALGLLDRFSSSYPSSPLAEGVLAERMRILRSIEPRRAASVAREYIARYPRGFARSEADAAVAEGGP